MMLMAVRIQPFPPDLPLFRLPADPAIARLADERAALQGRIAELRPLSHRRIELTARLRELTTRQMRLELEANER